MTPPGHEVQSTKTRTTRNHGDRRSTTQNERSQCRKTDNEWHTVRRYHDHDRRDSTPTNAALHSSSTPCCYFCGESGHVKQNCRHDRKLQCHTCQSFGHKSKFCQYKGHGNDETAGKVNSLHSQACTHVTPLGNHLTVLNSINDGGTVFNLNQFNTPACCNDDYE